MTRWALSLRARTRGSGSGTGTTVGAEGTNPTSGVRTRARGFRRRQFGSAAIRTHPAGGILWLRVTAHAFARATNRSKSLQHVSDANVVRSSANRTKWRFGTVVRVCSVPVAPTGRKRIGRSKVQVGERPRPCAASAPVGVPAPGRVPSAPNGFWRHANAFFYGDSTVTPRNWLAQRFSPGSTALEVACIHGLRRKFASWAPALRSRLLTQSESGQIAAQETCVRQFSSGNHRKGEHRSRFDEQHSETIHYVQTGGTMITLSNSQIRHLSEAGEPTNL